MPAAGIPQIEMYELRLAARARHASEPHGPGTREIVVVLSGSMTMTVGDHSDQLGPGDSVVFDANKPHVYENSGSSEARYHNVIASSTIGSDPPSGGPRGASAIAEGPLDSSVIADNNPLKWQRARG